MLNSRAMVVLACVSALAIGCGGGKKRVSRRLPDAPEISRPAPPPPVVANDRRPPIFIETGMASWYGPPYHNRKAANGEIYDMNSLSAAHRTLPLNSIVRVTNLKTSHSAILRITDRG